MLEVAEVFSTASEDEEETSTELLFRLCSFTYVKANFPASVQQNKNNVLKVQWKSEDIGKVKIFIKMLDKN